MNEFPPARRRGLIVHLVAVVLLSAISLTMFWLLFQSSVGLFFTFDLLIALLTLIPVPILGYRAYALLRSNYFLNRDYLRLAWGLRVEDIPLADVEWVRPLDALSPPVRLPLLRLPGGILGGSRHPELGSVEFVAAEAETLLLVATARQTFAISPSDPAAFTAAFQRAIEMGSLAHAESHSQYPSFVISVAWENLLVRTCWIVGGVLNVGLLLWVTIIAPGLPRISLGFTPARLPQPPSPGAELILLPLLSILSFVMGWIIGLFFFRREDQQMLAVMVWCSSAVSTVLFALSVVFILITPV